MRNCHALQFGANLLPFLVVHLKKQRRDATNASKLYLGPLESGSTMPQGHCTATTFVSLIDSIMN